MRIVIIGAGKLGYSIAELLSKEQYDIVVVDQNESRLETVRATLDVLTIAANGSSPITMNDADIRGADILIAVTASDEVNMISCILAKKHGIHHTIARIRDIATMVAYVRAENKPMLTVFERAGFRRVRSEEPDEVNLQLQLHADPTAKPMEQ